MKPYIDYYEPDLPYHEKSSMYFHIIVATLCMPFYIIVPLFGLLTSPYLMWMAFARRSALLVPLMIHMMHGSHQRYMFFLACFLYSIIHFNLVTKNRLTIPFLLYLCSFPFFIWYTWMRYRLFGGGIGAGGTFEGLGYYFGISTFFWGFIAIGRLPPTVTKGIIWLSVVCTALHSVLFYFIPFTRFLFWSIPFLPIVLVWILLQRGRIFWSRYHIVGIFGFMVAIMGLLGIGQIKLTFTLLGTICAATLCLIIVRYARRLLWIMTPVIVLPLLTWWMFNTIDEWEKSYKGQGDSTLYDEIKIRNWESFKYKLNRKIMGDRALVWSASWDAIQKQFAKDPIWIDVLPTFGSIEEEADLNRKGGRIVTVGISAHNMLLEMLRLYGAWGGLGIYLVFLLLPSLRINRQTLIERFASPYAPILSCCLAHVIVGGQTGQYPITPNFSFYLFGLMGICAGSMRREI